MCEQASASCHTCDQAAKADADLDVDALEQCENLSVECQAHADVSKAWGEACQDGFCLNEACAPHGHSVGMDALCTPSCVRHEFAACLVA